MELTSKLLKTNPEYYTIWNHRRLIIQHLSSELSGHSRQENSETCHEATANLISEELSFLLPLLRKFPKCYWIWNYRLWILLQSTQHLQTPISRRFWQQELALASKMLSLDNRNFHGWGYRRTIVQALESPELQIDASTNSLVEQEFEYTTKMIRSSLSNFSAWHTRSKLIPRLLTERKADKAARRKFLDEGILPLPLSHTVLSLTTSQELELIQRALWAGSDDQSLWFYHQSLMSTFDPKYAEESMAPDLLAEERLAYVLQEIDRIQEMLDGAEDCKWIYQALLHLSTLCKALTGRWCIRVSEIQMWVNELVKLDPLRSKRWTDLKQTLEDPEDQCHSNASGYLVNSHPS